ncbi:MAG TPA: TldD/PmbA family protein [Verrucomicrobiae bacterium]|nr:TldD/PmbA family protein [Verrucomicrobiae bacterium]
MNSAGAIGEVERLLKGKGLDGYEIVYDWARTLSIEVSEGKVESFRCAAPSGVAIRVLRGNGLGFSFSTSLAPADLSRMVEGAIVGAEAQTPDPCHSFPLPGQYPSIPGMVDEALAAVPEEEKIARAVELERLTLAADPRVSRVRKATYGETYGGRHIRNSIGVDCAADSTSVSGSVSAIASDGADTQMGWDFSYGTRYSDVDVAAVAKGAAARATALLGARKIGTMRCPAVLDRYVAGEVLDVLAPAFLAENIQKGKSLLAGKLGSELFSRSLRIRDDGTLPEGMATFPFDGEGVPMQDTVVVEEGVVTSFLYDTLRGCREGVPSTGNGVRDGIRSPLRMGVTNFFIENGTSSVRDLLSGAGRGVLVTEVMGMHTANPVSGEFSVGASGFYIENGEVVHPVREIVITGSILDIFRDVLMVGNDLRFFGTVASPSLLVGALDVSGH